MFNILIFFIYNCFLKGEKVIDKGRGTTVSLTTKPELLHFIAIDW